MVKPNMLHVAGEPESTHTKVTGVPHGSDITAGFNEALRRVSTLTPEQIRSLSQMAGVRPPVAHNQ